MREYELVDYAANEAARLVREEGYPPSEAVRIVSEAAILIAGEGGRLGAVTDTITAAAESAPLKEARALISPWLWILSVISFGMAVTNYQRVQKMFSDWRRRSRR